jgi:LDH2 family malate/lactate/ureidoglycolate dehydrogenase
MEKKRYVKPEIVRRFIVDLFGRYGVCPADAAMVADNLIDAEIRGVTTHGLTRIPLYIEKIEHGLCDPVGKPEVIRSTPGTAVIDAKNCLGQVSATMAMELAICKARSCGVSFVGVRNGCHYGTAGYYALMAQRQGMIGVSTTNSGVFVAPFGGVEPRLGTNPVAVALPSKRHLPVLLDMATSRVSRGKILVSMKKGESIPGDWALDSDGHPTTDSRRGFCGTLLPLGYKGYGMAVVIDMLSGILMSSGFGNRVDLPQTLPVVGSNFMAINTEAFCGIDEFARNVDILIDEIKDVKLADDAEQVYMPGEIEFNIQAENEARGGVPLQDFQLKELGEMAAQNGLTIEDYFD